MISSELVSVLRSEENAEASRMDVDLAGLHPPLSDDDLVPPGDFAYFDKSLASKLPSVSLPR